MEKKIDEQETLLKRKWRKYYRRSRIYVPLIVLLLLTMIVMLPIRGGWLARFIERQVKAKTQVELSIQSAELHLIEGSITLQGLTLKPGSGEKDISVERISLSGTLADLMAGDGRYPRLVEVNYGTPLLIDRTKDGFEFDSALRVLIHTIQESQKKPADSPTGSGRTPEVVLRNIPITFNNQRNHNTITAHVTTIEIQERSNKNAPVDVAVEGLINDPLPEAFDLAVKYLPETGSLDATFQLDGLEQLIPMNPSSKLGPDPLVELNAEGIQLDISVLGLNLDSFQLRADLLVDKLQTRHMVPGGRRWNQSNVALDIRSTLSKVGNPVQEWTASLTTPLLEVAADGRFNPDEKWVGQAAMQIRKTPPILWAIMNEQLAIKGLGLDETTSPTVSLSLTAAGDFTQPRTLDVDAETTLRRLRLNSLTQPYALQVDSLTILGNLEKITISNLSGNFSDRVEFSLAASLQNFMTEEPQFTLERLILNGDPGNSLIELRELIPQLNKVLSLSVPLQVALTGNFPLLQRPEGWRVNWFSDKTEFDGSLKWDASQLKITETNQPISFEPGQFRFTENTATLTTLQARVGEVDLAANVNINSQSGRWITDAVYTTRLTVSGTIRSILDLVQEQTTLPFAVTDYTGELATTVDVKGSIATLLNPDYTLSATLRKFTGRIPLPYSELNIKEGELDLNVTRDRISITQLRGIANDSLHLGKASIDVTREIATIEFELMAPLEEIAHLLAHETMDMFMKGNMSSTLKASLKPVLPLPEGDSVLESWAAGFKTAPKPLLSLAPDAPFALEVAGQVTPLPVISVFHRDMPHPIENIRGGVTVDHRGFEFKDVVADLGNTHDARLNGRVNLGHYGGGVVIKMDVKANKLDFNEWFSGWGRRDYARREFVEPSYDVEQNRPEKLITELDIDLHLRETALLSVRGQDLDAHVRYEAYRKQDNKLFATLKDAVVYGGRLEGDAEFVLPKSRERLTSFKTTLIPQEVEMRNYLMDLLKGENYPRGKVTGRAYLAGEIGDYNTWEGEAEFRATKSRFIGEQSFVLLNNFLNLADKEKEADTIISGNCVARNQVISFPAIRVESSEIRMLTSGTVGFNGMTDFLVTVDLYRNQLGNIPLISELNTFLNRLRNSLVSFRVSGKIGHQKVEPVPLPIQNIDFFAEGRRLINTNRSKSN